MVRFVVRETRLFVFVYATRWRQLSDRVALSPFVFVHVNVPADGRAASRLPALSWNRREVTRGWKRIVGIAVPGIRVVGMISVS